MDTAGCARYDRSHWSVKAPRNHWWGEELKAWWKYFGTFEGQNNNHFTAMVTYLWERKYINFLFWDQVYLRLALNVFCCNRKSRLSLKLKTSYLSFPKGWIPEMSDHIWVHFNTLRSQNAIFRSALTWIDTFSVLSLNGPLVCSKVKICWKIIVILN